MMWNYVSVVVEYVVVVSEISMGTRDFHVVFCFLMAV